MNTLTAPALHSDQTRHSVDLLKTYNTTKNTQQLTPLNTRTTKDHIKNFGLIKFKKSYHATPKNLLNIYINH